MSSVILTGDTSGTLTLSAPAVAGSNTVTLPAATGTISLLGQATTVSASGTSVDFTNIPSWTKRITVMFNGVSLNGSSQIQVQLGDSGGIETTGYTSGAWVNNVGATSTTGLLCTGGFVAAWTYTGIAIISTMGSNVWVSSSNGANSSSLTQGAGSKTLSNTITQIRITSLNGTDSFDAGTINIMYEG